MRATLRKKFGIRVVALRKAVKPFLSQEELAERAGFARPYMSRIERGTANPSLDAIESLAGGLKVPVARLFED